MRTSFAVLCALGLVASTNAIKLNSSIQQEAETEEQMTPEQKLEEIHDKMAHAQEKYDAKCLDDTLAQQDGAPLTCDQLAEKLADYSAGIARIEAKMAEHAAARAEQAANATLAEEEKSCERKSLDEMTDEELQTKFDRKCTDYESLDEESKGYKKCARLQAEIDSRAATTLAQECEKKSLDELTDEQLEAIYEQKCSDYDSLNAKGQAKCDKIIEAMAANVELAQEDDSTEEEEKPAKKDGKREKPEDSEEGEEPAEKEDCEKPQLDLTEEEHAKFKDLRKTVKECMKEGDDEEDADCSAEKAELDEFMAEHGIEKKEKPEELAQEEEEKSGKKEKDCENKLDLTEEEHEEFKALKDAVKECKEVEDADCSAEKEAIRDFMTEHGIEKKERSEKPEETTELARASRKQRLARRF